MGVADRIRLYMRPFITRNQAIKTPEKVDQTIKQAPRDESNDQALILTIKFLDRRRRWKYRAHSSDYPLYIITCVYTSIVYVSAGGGMGRGGGIVVLNVTRQPRDL